jgi:putative peptidoglycan binding protein
MRGSQNDRGLQKLMPINYTVSQGECVSSISERNGFLPNTIWNHPENANLKTLRKDPNVLNPGDVLYIPDRDPKILDRPTDAKHVFKLKGVPAMLRIRLLDGDDPRAGVPYQLEIDGKWVNGSTDGDGVLVQPIPPSAQRGKLLVGEGPTQDTHELNFGTVDPIETDDGVKKRLSDLGYGTDDMTAAIKAYQQKAGMEATGQVDDSMRSHLKEFFGQ